MTVGLIASTGALILATAFGLYWRARNGRVVAAAGGVPASSTQAIPAPASQAAAGQEPGEPVRDGLSQDDLGTGLGSRATLVQFSSAFCAPCRATRRILADVAGMTDGVRHVEIDAESRLDLVRRLDVRRTPTTFVLGPDGRVTHRASGQPRKADVIAALGAVL